MDELLDYNSDSSNNNDAPEHNRLSNLPKKSLTPYVDVNLATLSTKDKFQHPTTQTVYQNLKFEELYTPIQGPELPYKRPLNSHLQNALTGHVEQHSIDNFVFDEQYHTFQNFGYAQDPSRSLLDSNNLNIKASDKRNDNTVFNQSKSQVKKLNELKVKRKSQGNPSDIDNWKGPQADIIENEDELEAFANEQEERRKEQEIYQKEKALKEKRRKLQNNDKDGLGDSDLEEDGDNKTNTVVKEQNNLENESKKIDLPENLEETTVFEYNGDKYDYQGRSYIHCPIEERNREPDHRCFIPKSQIHTQNGHKKAVSAIRQFPETGHLLLSASMDTTLKLQDVNSHKKCLRTMNGHLQGVRDITFNNDGTKFLSVSFDTYIKLWDTETGKCISRFTSGSIPFCSRFNPSLNGQFIVGQKNKLIVGWDIRLGKIVQKYAEHLSAVNTVTFVDENRRFVSTSDDKKIFVQEYGIPVVLKHISEPNMHSVPFMTVTKDYQWALGQSLDNQIQVYYASGNFRQNRRKRFGGHNVAGFACQVDTSPDGQFVMSGDSEGRVFFWDQKTSKIYKRLHAHDKVVIGAIQHPVHPSRIATCSWDGTIKFQD